MTDLRSELGLLCTSCGRRRATYLRRMSGERLCGLCFERALVRTVKRALRYVKELRPGVSVASLIIPERLITSLTMLYLLNKIERKYGCRVLPLAFSTKGYRELIEDVGELIVKGKMGFEGTSLEVVEVYGGLKDTACEILNYYLKVLHAEMGGNIPVVAVPLTLNDVNEIVIKSLLDGDLGPALLQPSFKKGDVTYVIPFYSVPTYEVYAFSYVRGIYDLTLDGVITEVTYGEGCSSNDYALIKELVRDLSYNNPELSQTLLKTVNSLLRRYVTP